jgi:hypothetical protein
MTHLFGKNQALQTIFDIAAPLAVGAATAGFGVPLVLGAEGAAALGAIGTGALEGAVGGAVSGAGTGLLTTGQPLKPALIGGAAGGVLGGLGGAAFGGGAGDAAGGLPSAAGGADFINAAGADAGLASATGGELAGGFGGAAAGDLAGGFGGAAVAPVTPFTQAAEGIPTFGGGGDIATAAGAPQATFADIGGPAAGGGAGPGGSVGAIATNTPPVSLAGGGGPGALDFTAATQAPGEGGFFTGTTDTASQGGGVFAPIGSNDPVPPIPPAEVPAPIEPQPWQMPGTWTPSGTEGVANVQPQNLLQRIGGGISDTAGKVTDYVGDHPFQTAGLALTAGGLLKSLAAPQQIPGIPQLTNLSNQTGAQGQNLINQGLAQRSAPVAGATNLATSAVTTGQELAAHLENGTLPPGLQAQVDQAKAAAIQSIKAHYATLGPSQLNSSAMVQEINAVNERAVPAAAQIAVALNQQGLSFEQLGKQLYDSLISQTTGLLQTGAALTGQSGQQLNSLVATNVAQNNQVNNAIGNLGRALAGGNLNAGTVPV